MCIAVIKEFGSRMPNEATIRRCFSANPHGAGYCYLSVDRKVTIRKGFMTVEDLLADLAAMRFEDKHCLVMHFRYATHGLRDQGNCHPFPVVGEYGEMREVRSAHDVVAVHNGVFSAAESHDVASDTMVWLKVLADNRIDPFNPMQSKMVALATAGSRVAFIRGSDGHVARFGDWIKDAATGCWYSNSQYKEPVYESKPYSCGGGWGEWRWGSDSRKAKEVSPRKGSDGLNDDELELVLSGTCPWCYGDVREVDGGLGGFECGSCGDTFDLGGGLGVVDDSVLVDGTMSKESRKRFMAGGCVSCGGAVSYGVCDQCGLVHKTTEPPVSVEFGGWREAYLDRGECAGQHCRGTLDVHGVCMTCGAKWGPIKKSDKAKGVIA